MDEVAPIRSISLVMASLGAALLLLCAPLSAAAMTPAEIETKVREYFADAPIMVDVARCESRFRQFADSGNPLYGGYLGKMVGIFQIYADIHQSAAQGLGFDIETVEGNLGYTRHLYDRQGTDPWVSSISCWGKTPVAEATTEATTTTGGGVVQTSVQVHIPQGSGDAVLTKNLSLGMIDPEMRTVQKILNGAGYVLAPDGPGSPGQETDKYGALTREALRRFQCDKGIVCSGDEYSTGYGFIGPRTRAALMAAVGEPEQSSTSGTGTVTGNIMTIVEPASTTTPTETTGTQTQSDAEQIAQLQAQITELLKVIAALQAAQTQ